MADEIIFEKRGRTAHVTMNRPKQNNAINLAVRKGLCDAWEEIDRDPEIYTAVITGGEDIFSTGQDLQELAEFKEKDPLGDLPLNDLRTFGAQVQKPVIAAIGGYCLGFGFLMTMVAADIRIALDTARFGMPEVKVAVPPSIGIPPIAARYFPPAVAMELFLTGDEMTAEDAHRVGFVNKIVPPGKLLSTALAYAEKINRFSPLIVKNIKKVFKEIITPDPKDIAFSEAVCMLGRHSQDYLEGPRAFKEKRKPVWKGC